MIQNSTTCRFCEFPIGECWDVNQFMFYLCLFYLHCNVSDWWRMPVQRASAPYQTPCCAAESTLVVHRGCPLPPRHNPPPIPLLLWPSGGHTASGSLPGLPFLPLSTATSPPPILSELHKFFSTLFHLVHRLFSSTGIPDLKVSFFASRSEQEDTVMLSAFRGPFF